MATYNTNFRRAGMIGTSGGSNAYGSVPKQTAMPDPAGDLGKVYPNLSESNTAISQNILDELNAEISPGTIANLQDNAASFGVASGMPGSQFSGYRGLRNLGIESQDMQRAGLQDYLAATQGIKSTQTVSPETQIGLNQSNAILAAAPDPAAAAAEQQRLFNLYLDQLNRSSGGTGSRVPERRASGWSRAGGTFDYDLKNPSDLSAYSSLQGRIYSGL